MLKCCLLHRDFVLPRWKFSQTQIRDTDSYSDIDSTKHSFGLNNQTLYDYYES